eukprot:76530_1
MTNRMHRIFLSSNGTPISSTQSIKEYSHISTTICTCIAANITTKDDQQQIFGKATELFSTSISLINNNSTNNSYKYNINIESFDQKYSTNVIELNTLYNISHNSIKYE